MGIAAVIAGLLPTLATLAGNILSAEKITTPAISNLIEVLATSGASLFGMFSQKSQTILSDLQGVLAQLQAALKAAQADTSISAQTVADIEEAISLVEAAIQGLEDQEKGNNPADLTPLPPVE